MPTNRSSQPGSQGTSGSFQNNTTSAVASGEGDVFCNCNLEALQLTVRKDGPNKGNKIYENLIYSSSVQKLVTFRKKILQVSERRNNRRLQLFPMGFGRDRHFPEPSPQDLNQSVRIEVQLRPTGGPADSFEAGPKHRTPVLLLPETHRNGVRPLQVGRYGK